MITVSFPRKARGKVIAHTVPRWKSGCLVADNSSTAAPPQTFAFHEDHEGGVKLVGGQFFLEVKRPLPFDFIIGDAIVLVAPPHRATLRGEQSRKVKLRTRRNKQSLVSTLTAQPGVRESPCPIAAVSWEAYERKPCIAALYYPPNISLTKHRWYRLSRETCHPGSIEATSVPDPKCSSETSDLLLLQPGDSRKLGCTRAR